MMRARALAYAVRGLFPEVLLGSYTDLEMADVDNHQEYPVTMTEEGDVILEVIPVSTDEVVK